MALLGNFNLINKNAGRTITMGASTHARNFGNDKYTHFNKLGFYANADSGETSSTVAVPTGYYPQGAWVMPIKAGEMSAKHTGSGTVTANLYPSKNMEVDLTGSGDLTASGSLAISMLAALTGSGTLTATIEGRLNMTADLTGSGDLDATLSALGNMVAGLSGSGDIDATISAFGNMEIDIVVTGTGLSTANVGQAVWAALLDANNEPDTFGERVQKLLTLAKFLGLK